MFTLIQPKQHDFYKTHIEHFLKLKKKYQETSLSIAEKNSATFILAEDKKWGVYGGAQLLPKKIKFLPEKIREELESFLSQEVLVWVCTTFLYVANKSSSKIIGQNEVFSGIFYYKLYEKLVEFGESQGMGFLCMTLNPSEHLRTKEMGLWSYAAGIDPSESADGLFHGILFLMRFQQEAYKREWEVRSNSSSSPFSGIPSLSVRPL